MALSSMDTEDPMTSWQVGRSLYTLRTAAGIRGRPADPSQPIASRRSTSERDGTQELGSGADSWH